MKCCLKKDIVEICEFNERFIDGFDCDSKTTPKRCEKDFDKFGMELPCSHCYDAKPYIQCVNNGEKFYVTSSNKEDIMIMFTQEGKQLMTRELFNEAYSVIDAKNSQ